MRNALKDIWAAGRPVANGWLGIGSPFGAEIMAAQGFDSLTIDIQHGAFDYASALSMLQAMGGSDVVPIVRVPWRGPGHVMKALDAGAMGVICPMVNTAEEAAEFVSYMRYPPRGQRSFGPMRASVSMGGYGREMDDEVLAFAMIETAQGMKNLDAIVATPGLDGIYVGPADLTLGTQGGRLAPGFDREEPEMIDQIRAIAAACGTAGIHAGIHCGSAAYAWRAVEWGYDLVTVSSDTSLLASSAAESVRAFRDLAGDTG